MQAVVIRASELGNRWDAGFHVLRKQHEPRSRQIEESLDKATATKRAVRLLRTYPADLRKVVNPLVRRGGMTRAPDVTEQEKAVREYPYIALAVLEGIADEVQGRLDAEAASAAATAELFGKLIAETRETKGEE